MTVLKNTDLVAGIDIARLVYKELGKHLALGLSHAVNLLDIERIVLGGGVAKAGPYFLQTTRNALGELLPDRRIKPQVVATELGDTAGLLGAGFSVLSRLSGG